MNKDTIKDKALLAGLVADDKLYAFAASLLRAYHLENLMCLNKELDKYPFMGKHWSIVNDCQSSLSKSTNKSLDNISVSSNNEVAI